MASVRLFVYGSLKRGGLHHDQLKSATFLGEVETEPGFTLVTLGAYLALVPPLVGAPNPTRVPGELFEVPLSLLPVLDEFEGANYERAELAVRPAGVGARDLTGQTGAALAYFLKSR